MPKMAAKADGARAGSALTVTSNEFDGLTAALPLAAGSAVLRVVERWVVSSSTVPTTPFLDPRLLPWTLDLERAWPKVRTELDRVLERHEELPNFQDISAAQASISRDDRWKTFFLFGFGARAEKNCLFCPHTTAALERVPGLITAFFSILSPGTHIDPHRGPYRGLLRYHLGLRIPDPRSAVGLSVGGKVEHWSEGYSLLFDDGYEHFAWNDTDDLRAVLFVDVIRPARPLAAIANRTLLRSMAWTPYVRSAKRRQEEWSERHFRK